MRRFAACYRSEIARIQALPPDRLRWIWRAVFGRTPPANLSTGLLGRMITWHIQERAFGGLDRDSLRFLDSLARGGHPPRRQLKPGTVLVRDYQANATPSRSGARASSGRERHVRACRPSPAPSPARPGAAPTVLSGTRDNRLAVNQSGGVWQ